MVHVREGVVDDIMCNTGRKEASVPDPWKAAKIPRAHRAPHRDSHAHHADLHRLHRCVAHAPQPAHACITTGGAGVFPAVVPGGIVAEILLAPSDSPPAWSDATAGMVRGAVVVVEGERRYSARFACR